MSTFKKNNNFRNTLSYTWLDYTECLNQIEGLNLTQYEP